MFACISPCRIVSAMVCCSLRSWNWSLQVALLVFFFSVCFLVSRCGSLRCWLLVVGGSTSKYLFSQRRSSNAGRVTSARLGWVGAECLPTMTVGLESRREKVGAHTRRSPIPMSMRESTLKRASAAQGAHVGCPVSVNLPVQGKGQESSERNPLGELCVGDLPAEVALQQVQDVAGTAHLQRVHLQRARPSRKERSRPFTWYGLGPLSPSYWFGFVGGGCVCSVLHRSMCGSK